MNATQFRRRAGVIVALSTLLWAGCFSKSATEWGGLIDKKAGDPSKRLAGRSKLDVVARSLGSTLGNSQEISLEPKALAGRVAELLSDDKPSLATAWIRRHPETTLEALRSQDEALPSAALRHMAKVHDRQTVVDGRPIWTEMIALRNTNAPGLKRYAEMRSQFHERVADGLIDRAIDLTLVATAAESQSVALEIDARQLRGTALLLGERPADAVVELAAAVAAAENISAYQSAYLLLLLSDAQRRAGDGAGASQTWQRAIVTASYLVEDEPVVADPVLWERLSYLRPVDKTWPADVVARLAAHAPLPGVESQDDDSATASDSDADPAAAETVIWHCIGRWYLDRGHAQASLVAFKRAESASTDDVSKQWLRFRQAKALTQLKQEGPATAIIMGLLANKPAPLERPASALLGSLYLHRGQTPRGLALLKKAVEADDGVVWEERSEAEADLGLAYLSVGDADNGLARLHRAQQLFESEDETESLVASLENELKFLEHAGKKKEAAAVKTRLRELEKKP